MYDFNPCNTFLLFQFNVPRQSSHVSILENVFQLLTYVMGTMTVRTIQTKPTVQVKSVQVNFVVNIFCYCGPIIVFEEFLIHIANMSCQKLYLNFSLRNLTYFFIDSPVKLKSLSIPH